VKDNAPVDRMRSLSAELQQVYQSLVASRPADTGASPDGADQTTQPADEDDVIDADFTVS
jgi:molecular chaperone DnaK